MEKQPLLMVDVIILAEGGVVLVKRGTEPYKGKWALPGGFVRYGEKVDNAAAREAEEETGLKVRVRRLVNVYSDPKRDPRGHAVSTCFTADVVGGKLTAGSDAAEVRVFKQIPWGELAFDHALMLKDAGLG
jgi:8-oxo-dGTP diphosphatase